MTHHGVNFKFGYKIPVETAAANKNELKRQLGSSEQGAMLQN